MRRHAIRRGQVDVYIEVVGAEKFVSRRSLVVQRECCALPRVQRAQCRTPDARRLPMASDSRRLPLASTEAQTGQHGAGVVLAGCCFFDGLGTRGSFQPPATIPVSCTIANAPAGMVTFMTCRLSSSGFVISWPPATTRV